MSLECECENVVDCSTLKWILDAQVHFFEHMFLLMHEYYLQVQGGWQLVYMWQVIKDKIYTWHIFFFLMVSISCEFLNQCEEWHVWVWVWHASWNICDPWIFPFILWKPHDFPESLHTRRAFSGPPFPLPYPLSTCHFSPDFVPLFSLISVY